MLYKSTVLFVALFASSVVATPIPGEKFTRAAVAGGCNATAVQANLAQMKDVANNILSVGSPLPDPFRANDADVATFDTVVSAIADAGTAAAAGDFNTTASKVSFVNNAVSGLLDGKVADGLESSIDLDLADLADQTNTLLSACVAPGTTIESAAPVPGTSSDTGTLKPQTTSTAVQTTLPAGFTSSPSIPSGVPTASGIPKTSSSSSHTAVIAGVAVAVITAVIVVALLVLFIRRGKLKRQKLPRNTDSVEPMPYEARVALPSSKAALDAEMGMAHERLQNLRAQRISHSSATPGTEEGWGPISNLEVRRQIVWLTEEVERLRSIGAELPAYSMVEPRSR